MSRVLLLLTLTAAPAGAAQDTSAVQEPPRLPADALPLFAAHDVLAFTITGDLDALRRDRRDREEHPATLTVAHGDSPVALDVQLRTRGKFRLQRRTCGFPNYRLNVRKSQVVGTVFDGQDRIKVVAHCQDRRDDYEENTIQEYLAYRILNLLTPVSFRVRLARVTYVNTGKEPADTLTKYAFLIEDAEHVAERNGLTALKVPVVPPELCDWDYLTLAAVFQYLLGNTDWSGFMAEPGENECCHNMVPIGHPTGPVLPVPYDFDMSGFVNPRYATVAPQLEIRTVRERLYRGFCHAAPLLPAAFERFNAQRPAIEALVREASALDERTRARMLDYIGDFYRVINDPRLVEREFHRRCRRLG